MDAVLEMVLVFQALEEQATGIAYQTSMKRHLHACCVHRPYDTHKNLKKDGKDVVSSDCLSTIRGASS